MPRLLASADERREKLLQAGSGLSLIAGWGLSVLALFVWSGEGAYLDSSLGVGVFLHALLVVGALVLCAGLPVERHEPRVLWGAGGQVFAGFITASATFYIFRLTVTEGSALVAWLPTAVAGVLLVVMGFLYQWLRWRVRAFTPPLVWAVLSVLVFALR